MALPLYRNMREVAKRGGGFTYYIWPNPAHSNSKELKLTYVLKVDEGLWLGAGTYLTGEAPILSNESREDLVAFVDGARDFALNTTKEVALKTFNDKNGKFVEGNRYIFAYDYDGNALALPYQPELIGKNRIDIKDSNGVEYIRDMIALAKSGSGSIYYIKQDPARNMTQGFMCWYGFYTSNDPKHILFSIAFDKIVDDNRTFEKIVEQKYAINDLPTEQFEKEVDSNFTLAFVPRGEWTTTNEGRKMYFEGNPYVDPITGSHLHNPYALIDFSNASQIVDIEAAYADSDAILAISKTFKFTAEATEQPKKQPGFESLLAAVGLFVAGYMRGRSRKPPFNWSALQVFRPGKFAEIARCSAEISAIIPLQTRLRECAWQWPDPPTSLSSSWNWDVTQLTVGL